MRDANKTKAQLIDELETLRAKVTTLEQAETEHKQTEEALQESERQFSDIAKNIPGMVFQFRVRSDGSSYFSYASPRATELFEFPADMSSPDWDLGAWTHPDDREDFFASIAQAIENRTGWNFEGRFITPGGETKWFQGISSPSQIGNELVFNGVLLDITERKLAEQALHDSEQRFRSIIESIPLGMHMYQLEPDNRLIFLHANPAADEILGIENSQFVGLTIEEAFPPLIETEVPERYRLAAAQGVLWQTEQIAYEDDQISGAFEVRAFQTTPGKMAATFHDITDRKRTEQALRQSEALYRSLFEGIDDVIFVHDEEANILDVNEATCRRLGYTREELLQMKTTDIDAPDYAAGVKDRLALQLTAGGLSEISGVHIARDGRRIHVDTNSRLINYKGKPAVLAVVRDITERKRAEEALRESEEKYRDLIENMHDVIFAVDGKGVATYVSPAIEMFLGHSPSEIIGQPFAKFVHPEDLQLVQESFRNMIAGGQYHSPNVYRVVAKSGAVRWMRTSSRPILQGDRVVGIQGILVDITERKQAEEALRGSEEKFRTLAEQSPNMIFINQMGKVVYANAKCEEMLAYRRDEFYAPDFDFLDLIGPKHHEVVKSTFARHMSGEEVEPYEYSLVTKRAELIEVIITTKLINYEGQAAILGIVTDITERKQAEQELRASQQFLQSTLDALAANIAILDSNGTIVDVNAAWSQFAKENGCSEAKCGVGVNYLSVCDTAVGDNSDEALAVAQGLRELITNERAQFNLEYPCHSPEQQRWFVMRATQFGNHDAVRVVVAHEDITERIQAEQQRVELTMERERGVVLQRFVKDASHDLRTPLTTIKTSLHLLPRLTDPARQQQHIDIMETQATHLQTLLENMLDMSRLAMTTEFRFGPVDLNKLIQNLLVAQRPLAESKKHNLRFTGSPAVPPIPVDSLQLRRAITNIAVNAINYTPDGGTIAIQTALRDERVIIEIQDTGIGIDAADLPHIFDHFYRADKARSTITGGAGLGLTIAQKIIATHHGRIEVESEVGKGSTFRIIFPVGDAR